MSVATISKQLTREEARRLLQSTPTVPRLFWRSSYPNATIGLCGAHAIAWPRPLGTLRLFVETPLLHQVFGDIVARHLVNYRSGVSCRGCEHLRAYTGLDPYQGLDSYGPAPALKATHRGDDERGLLADPDFGQPVVVERVKVVRVKGKYSNCSRWFDDRQGQVFTALGASQWEQEPLHAVYFVRDGGEVRELPVMFAEVEL